MMCFFFSSPRRLSTFRRNWEQRKARLFSEVLFIVCQQYFLPVYDGPGDHHGQWVQQKVGGVQAALVAVPVIQAYEEALKSVKRGGRVVAVGLPAENISVSIFWLVLSGIQLIGSVVGTRQDLNEALELAKLHNIVCKVQKRKLEDINEIFEDMKHYRISGRAVIDFSASS